MTAIIDGTNGVTTPNVLTSSSGVALTLQSGGTTAVTIDTSQNISFGSGVTINAYQGTSPSNGAWMGTVGSAGFFLANQTSTNTNLYLSKASGYTDSSLLTTSVNGVTLGGLRVTSGNTAMNLYGVSGITFPATQIASADANTLDDYEEGTWTPSLGGTATYGANAGNYVKVGRLVFAVAIINVSSIGTGSTTVISGLPFTNGATNECNCSIGYLTQSSSTFSSVYGYVAANGTTIQLSTIVAGGSGSVDTGPAIFKNNTQIRIQAVYYANA